MKSKTPRPPVSHPPNDHRHSVEDGSALRARAPGVHAPREESRRKPAPTARLGAPLLDHGAEDGMSTDSASANQLPAEQQLARFLHWLQFTDRGHQPC